MADTPKRKFRLNCKNLFLTWPKNDTDSGQCMDALMEKFGSDNISYICVSEEEHEDGTPHLHALVCLKSKCDIKDATALDLAGGGKHGNYQSARKVKDVYQYVKKGGVFVEHGTLPISETEKKSSAVAELIRKGGNLDQVDEMDPGYFMNHQKNIKDYYHFHKLKRAKTRHLRAPLSFSKWGHMFEVGYPREHKEKQYWIHGKPNTGKTTLIQNLRLDGFSGYHIPSNNDFYAYDDHSYDFAYIDEFRGQLTVQFLNLWLEGSHMTLNTKGGSVEKTKNLPTFIISNMVPMEIYRNVSSVELDSLASRLYFVESK